MTWAGCSRGNCKGPVVHLHVAELRSKLEPRRLRCRWGSAHENPVSRSISWSRMSNGANPMLSQDTVWIWTKKQQCFKPSSISSFFP
jgi:hypothetical protein